MRNQTNGSPKRPSQYKYAPDYQHENSQYYPHVKKGHEQNYAAQEDATDNADAWADIK